MYCRSTESDEARGRAPKEDSVAHSTVSSILPLCATVPGHGTTYRLHVRVTAISLSPGPRLCAAQGNQLRSISSHKATH